MILLALPVFKLCVQNVPLESHHVQDLKQPANGERISRKLKYVEVLDHDSIDLVVLFVFLIWLLFKQRVEHCRIVNQVEVQELVKQGL